jgi:anaerobic ribonucleoside-triphosphate reductase activating protein
MIKRIEGIEGVTYSGGEPMAQAEGLYHLSLLLKGAGLSVVSYSGYTLDELRNMQDPWIGRLLSTLDVLIDGRYDQRQKVALPWRGSGNQRVHFLTKVYQHLSKAVNEPGSQVELIIGKNTFVSTGVFDETFLKRLEDVLNSDDSERPKSSNASKEGAQKEIRSPGRKEKHT